MEPDEMRTRRFPLDDTTADRLAAGELHPSDAPPGYSGVARVLTDARRGFAATEIDADLLGAMVKAVDASPHDVRTPSMFSKLLTAKVGTVAAALVFTTAGAAAAAGGHLPDPAQDAVAAAASHVGFDLPASNDDHPTGPSDKPTDRDNHGAEVSDVAHTTDATGADKGAAISEVARAGHGPDATSTTVAGDEAADESAEHGKPADPGSKAPVDTPNRGGTGTASDASGGKSDVGTAHASDQAAKGSANADDNPGTAHRP